MVSCSRTTKMYHYHQHITSNISVYPTIYWWWALKYRSTKWLKGGHMRHDIHIAFVFRDKFALSRFVLDVVRPRKDHVVLVDFNPWGETTDSLMFSWQELTDLHHSGHVEFRFTF